MYGCPQSNYEYGHHPRFRLPESPEIVAKASEDKDTFTLSFDVPGVKLEDVSIEEHDGVLTISAARKSGTSVITQLEKKYKIHERMVDAANIKAELEDGVLTIVIPKNKDAKTGPTSITITSGYPVETESGNDSASDEKNKVKEFRFSTDLPGVRLDDVEITLSDDDDFGTDTTQLIIHAKRQHQGAVVTNIYRKCFVSTASFDMTKIQAYLADGVLTVIAPPRAQVASTGIRKIPILGGASSLVTHDTKGTADTSIEPECEGMDINVETVKEEEK
jgi:HSP20 family molecular chaperone IbpA